MTCTARPEGEDLSFILLACLHWKIGIMFHERGIRQAKQKLQDGQNRHWKKETLTKYVTQTLNVCHQLLTLMTFFYMQ